MQDLNLQPAVLMLFATVSFILHTYKVFMKLDLKCLMYLFSC